MPPAYTPNANPDIPAVANLFDDLGAEIAARYAQAELEMIERISRLAAQGIANPPDLVERARVYGQLREEGERIARELADPTYAAKIVEIAARDGEAAAIASLGLSRDIATSSAVTSAAASATAQIALDLTSRLDDMSARITRWMPDTYQRVIADVTPNVILGVDTLRDAQRAGAQRLLERGVRGFTDVAGREWRIGTYAEMATRTSVNRAWQSSNNAATLSVGLNLVTIILGVDACKVCAAHAGKIYSIDGTPAGTYTLEHSTQSGTVSVTVAGTLDQARASGWNHPNCRCVTVAYFPGLSIPKGTTYDPQAEKDRDRLRELERRVRDLKRREVAAFDDVTKARLKGRIRSAQGDIRSHVANTGQLRKSYREQLGFSDGRPPLATPKPRALPPAPRPASPTPAPAPVPLAIAAPDVDDVAEILNAKGTPDILTALGNATARRGIRLEGFTPDMHPESVREVGATFLRLAAKYPENKIRLLAAEKMRKPGVLGTARRIHFRTGGTEATEMRINIAKLSKGARGRTVDTIQNSANLGHFHHVDKAQSFEYVVAHEFGHTVDYAGEEIIRKEVGRIRSEYLKSIGETPLGGARATTLADVNDSRRRAEIGTSAYGRGATGELIAEAFADVEVNGAAATELSKRIHERMIELMRGQS